MRFRYFRMFCVELPAGASGNMCFLFRMRLRTVIGQLNAVEKMIDKDVPCEDILIQINAAKSALHKIGQIVLEGHLKHCVRYGIEHGDAEKTLSDFSKALEHFSRMS